MMAIDTSAAFAPLDQRIAAVAGRLAQFGPESKDEQVIQAHLIAALYALRRALALETSEIPSPADDPAEELRRIAAELAGAEETGDARWLAGFYLATAEYRLSLIPARLKNYRTVEAQGLPSRQRRSVKMATQSGRIDEITAAVARLEELLGILLPE